MAGMFTLLAAAAHAAEPRLQYELGALEGNPQSDPLLVQIKSLKKSAQDRVTPQVIALPALAPEKAARLGAAGQGKPLQIGVARDVAQAASVAKTAALWQWVAAADGSHRAALAVQSAQAKGVRLGLKIEQLPSGTLLNVYAPGSGEVTQVHAAEVLRTIQRNVDAGVPSAQAHTYWLPTVKGDQAVLEVQLPAGVKPEWLKVSLPVVSHLGALPGDEDSLTKAAASCNVDVMCTSGNESRMRAVARMVFMSGGDGFLCSGTLLNNTRQDYTPYFLSANHCIANQAEASSLETYWNFRSASCNSTQLASDATRLSGGAQLLWTSTQTDTTLLRLSGSPPSTATFLGWNANTPSASNVPAFSIHHPKGDWQKYSEGSIVTYAQCQDGGANGVQCSVGNVSNGPFLAVQWSRGISESGSSGGPLFSSAGQVIGQLYAGAASCSAPTEGIYTFGRFDLAFSAGLSQWLSPAAATPTGGRAPVYRFYNSQTGAHFYTNSAAERDYVIATNPAFQYEGPNFYAYNSQATATTPVYRFYNTQTGVHFYTISAAERDHVIATNPAFQYEGTSWYARTATGGGSSALYRFYSAQRRAHFYTINAAEMEHVRATYPDFAYEGVGYYAWTSQ